MFAAEEMNMHILLASLAASSAILFTYFCKFSSLSLLLILDATSMLSSSSSSSIHTCFVTLSFLPDFSLIDAMLSMCAYSSDAQ